MNEPHTTPRANPASAQAVFDALDAFIAGTDYTNTTATLMIDGSGETHTIIASDASGNSERYETRSAGKKISIAPMSATLGPGATQQFTATAKDAAGVDIPGATFVWSVPGSALGSVTQTGLYTAPAAIAVATMETVTATLTGEQVWTNVTISLDPNAVKRGA